MMVKSPAPPEDRVWFPVLTSTYKFSSRGIFRHPPHTFICITVLKGAHTATITVTSALGRQAKA